MAVLHRCELVVFADYHQFTLQDGGVSPPAPDDWTDEDVARRVKVAPHVVVVCPARNVDVPVEVEVRSSEPGAELAGCDHAVRCSLALPTGALQLHECTGGEKLRLALAPGVWGVLVLFNGLGTLDPNDALAGADRYRIVLWPARETPLQVLRAWQGGGGGASGAR